MADLKPVLASGLLLVARIVKRLQDELGETRKKMQCMEYDLSTAEKLLLETELEMSREEDGYAEET